jgi:hypothetical protein
VAPRAVEHVGAAVRVDPGHGSEQPLHEVGEVDERVEDDAAARRGVVEPVGARLPAEDGRAGRDELAELAGRDALVHAGEGRREAQHEAELHHAIARAGARDDAVGRLEGERDRLLAEHVPSGVQGRDDLLGMEGVGRGHEHRVDVVAREQVVQRRLDVDPVVVGEGARDRGVDVGARDDRAALDAAVGVGVHASDAPRPDQADADVAHSAAPSCSGSSIVRFSASAR